MTIVPPIKSQGIKTKLVHWIRECSQGVSFGRWVEPFMGTGVVAFNIQPAKALLCDSNPHLIAFYKAIQKGDVTPQKARRFLTAEGNRLSDTNGAHYYTVRDRFNAEGNPFDFLFLSRSCFNGMMRFNKSGFFNVPFCRKPKRFAPALITKICNQIEAVSDVIGKGDYEFRRQEFVQTLGETGQDDLIYCDPPYMGRHVDYFDSWSETEERRLRDLLRKSQARFILSTWLKNRYRVNDYALSVWGECSILVREHFYHVGARESNRNAVLEALLVNFPAKSAQAISGLDFESALPVPPNAESREKRAGMVT